jgi:CheY-like chemotaxis protein
LTVLQKPITREALHDALDNLDLPPLSQGRTLTVVVVDDDPKAVEITAAHLRAPGYAVARTYGGREAIEAAQRLRPDLIILDLMMPDVNGFDVAEALAGNPDTANIPLLMVTAKQVTAEERAMFKRHVIDKAKLRSSPFLNEVRRALAPRDKEN